MRGSKHDVTAVTCSACNHSLFKTFLSRLAMSKEGNVTPYEMEKKEGCDWIWLVVSALRCQGQNLQALGLV